MEKVNKKNFALNFLGKAESVSVIGGGEVVDDSTSLSDERPIVGGCRLLSWRPGPLTSGRHLDDGSSLPQTASKTFGGTRPDHVHLLIDGLKFPAHPVRKALRWSRHLSASCSCVLLLTTGRACATFYQRLGVLQSNWYSQKENIHIYINEKYI